MADKKKKRRKNPRGEGIMIGPDGEVSDLQVMAEMSGEPDLLEMAREQRKRWAARRREIAREKGSG